MFTVEVDKYCVNCKEFDPVSTNACLYGGGELVMVDHTIECRHADRCKRVKEYLKKEQGE